jgi:hypothetical protein
LEKVIGIIFKKANHNHGFDYTVSGITVLLSQKLSILAQQSVTNK